MALAVNVTHNYPCAGSPHAGIFIATLLRKIAAHRPVEVVATTGPAGNRNDYQPDERIPEHRVGPVFGHGHSPLYKLPWAAMALGGKVRQLSRQQEIYTLHCHWAVPAGMVGSRGARKIVTLHGSDIRLLPPVMLRQICRRADIVTAASDYLARQIPFVENVRVNPMIYEDEVFCYDATARQIPETPELVVPAGLTAQKRIDLMLDVVGEYNDRYDSKLRLTVYGAGPLRERLSKRIEEQGLKANIMPPINQKELADVYRRATAAVLPSYREGYGMVLVEAMACGTPAVCLDDGGGAVETGAIVASRDTVLETIHKLTDRSYNEDTGRKMSAAAAAKNAEVLNTWLELYDV